MNSRYRCAGCKKYKTNPAHRRVGRVQVCSDGCVELVLDRLRRQPQLPLKRSVRKPTTRRNRDDPSQATRDKVLDRDRGICRFDAAHTADHVHHINYRSQGVDHQEHNLISLCQEHHDLVHSNKRRWQPLLRGVIWSVYVRRQPITVLQLERQLNRTCRF